MRPHEYTIWIEAEQWAEGEWDILDANSDAIVTFEDGSRWALHLSPMITSSHLRERINKLESV